MSEDFESVNPLKVSINTQDKTLVFDGIIHCSDKFGSWARTYSI